jgi:hypothetical protein
MPPQRHLTTHLTGLAISLILIFHSYCSPVNSGVRLLIVSTGFSHYNVGRDSTNVEDTKMSSKVDSAGRAFFPFHGMSKGLAWKELTHMFNPHIPTKYHKSYILKGRDLECIRRLQPDDISIGDIFKCVTAPEKYVEIVACTPYESFAYDEKWMPMSGGNIDAAYDNDSRSRMEFFLKSHPEAATLVEIRRRDKGLNRFKSTGLFNSGLFGSYLFTKEDIAHRAAEILQHILTGIIWKRDEIVRGELTIKRDDSYRIDF